MSHFYSQTGEPMHFAAPGGRPTGPATAKKLGLLPSPTTVLSDVLRKPGLERWIITQNLLAVITAPDVLGEAIDAKVERVLVTEKQQYQESAKAMDRGTQIHEALEAWFKHGRNETVAALETLRVDTLPWIRPAAEAIEAYGKVHAVERVLVGDGYAGKTDLILEAPAYWWLIDWKTTKSKLPSKAWPEATIQASAYAHAWCDNGLRQSIRTANVYISTVDCGKFIICEHDDWRPVYSNAFLPLLTCWKWLNGFV